MSTNMFYKVHITLSGKNTQDGKSSILIRDSIIDFSFVKAACRADENLNRLSFIHCLRKISISNGVINHAIEKPQYPNKYIHIQMMALEPNDFMSGKIELLGQGSLFADSSFIRDSNDAIFRTYY